LGFFILILAVSGCTPTVEELVLSGHTMGTTYTIKLIVDRGQEVDPVTLQQGVDSLLEEINRQMSTYREQSEISCFNRFREPTAFPVSSHFQRVVQRAQELAVLTGGAFDITVLPLVELWGFGPRTSATTGEWSPPDSTAIRQTLGHVGYPRLQVLDNALLKKDPDLRIDVNAIAKGYGVDVVFDYLVERGFSRLMVEIGGEARCGGTNRHGKPWRIGIDRPREGLPPGAELQTVVELSDRAVATSGDYRQYRRYGGRRYAHTLDPRSGYPIKTGVTSATVLAPTCMDADALATALMVLGETAGLRLVEHLEDVEAILVLREGERRFRERRSSGLEPPEDQGISGGE
jgi:thiamine biosynthesis lipoprotein